MTEIQELSHNLERSFLQKIIDGLRDKTFTIVQAKKHSIDFLSIVPFNTPEDAYVKIMDFVVKHPDFRELKIYMNDYQLKRADVAKIEIMKQYLKKQDIN